jgi:hypothetical protein
VRREGNGNGERFNTDRTEKRRRAQRKRERSPPLAGPT